ncbi:MAG TPA: HEAT repeat domain-containing protein [Candidatus Cloacimonadota bacterium]|nr:HEAT repeat domain-containing protein [Candidatus Cloacimonadota bacterium]
MPLDFCSGKIMTHPMHSTFSKDYKTIALEWNENAEIWISQKGFVQSDLLFIKNHRPLGLRIQHSADSNVYYFLHGEAQQRFVAFRELSSQNPDTLASLILQTFQDEPSSRAKMNYARELKLITNPNSLKILISLTSDSCKFVRLEAALSLSYLNEKKVSFKTFQNLWNLNDEILNLDNFPSFTVGMRNIATPKSIKFLIRLTQQKNPYCCLDASICLLQLGKNADCLKGLDSVLTCDNEELFYNAGLLIKRYYPDSILRQKLVSFLSGDNAKAQFSKFLLTEGN